MAGSVPFFTLTRQYQPLRSSIHAAVGRVLDSQQFILGPDVAVLEEELAAYTGSRYVITCASGSDALVLALLALGIGPGDEVLTTPFTFFATAGSIVEAGARPVFADIDPRSFNLDPHCVEEALRANPRIKALLPVHLYGACAHMEALLRLARDHGIPVIEDGAQSIGASAMGRQAGTHGDIGCFSFFPTKNLGGVGDGGFLTTQNPDLADRLKALRVHGSHRRYFHQYVGINSRLDTLQAAVLRVKLPHLDAWIAARQRNARFYEENLSGLSPAVTLPVPCPCSTRHVYNQFVIRAQHRDALREFLAARSIGSEIYYPLPLHLQECFQHLGYAAGSLPASEQAAQSVLALPIFPELTGEELLRVCAAIREFYVSRLPNS